MKKILISLLFINFINYSDTSSINNLRLKINKNEPPTWMIKQIKQDLLNLKCNVPEVVNLETNTAKIKILNGTINTESNIKNGWAQCRLSIIIKTLKIIHQAADLPNLTFYLSLRDGNVQPTDTAFTFSKKIGEKHILLPDPDSITNASSKNFELVTAKGSEKWPWDSKINTAFWRGTGNVVTRLNLVKLTLQHPNLLNAKFTGNLRYVPKVLNFIKKNELWTKERIDILDHLKYKYQIIIDGYSASWARVQWQLLSDCLIFKQESPYIQWFYLALKPYTHYIPCNKECSDLINQILWAQNNNKICHRISKNATKFALENLNYTDMLYYIYLLLQEYSKHTT